MQNDISGSAYTKGPILKINGLDPEAQSILKALGSKPRMQILDLLRDRVLNVSEISDALNMPLSTANLHIRNLEKAGLLMSELKPGERGVQKVCSRVFDLIMIQLPHGNPSEEQMVEQTMPIGAFVACDVTSTCGLASEHGIIGLFDDAASFYEPHRIDAQLLWFHHGYIEYRFPNRLPPGSVLDSLQLSMEICSEAPLHRADWPSDITVWFNGIEIGTWTSPGDFGGQRGVLTPDWWETWNSQYGLLKVWQVNQNGSYIDGLRLSDVKIEEIGLNQHPFISARIGVKADAKNVGGLNIFGQKFGNYPQDIYLRLRYQ